MSTGKNIVIVGAGVVGRQLAERLSEDHIVTIVDDYNRLRGLEDLYDVRVLPGDATTLKVMQSACNLSTDMVIAVTNSDAVNVLVSKIAKTIGAKHCIARIRGTDCFDGALSKDEMGIDRIIYPERMVTDRIHQLILHPHSLQRFSFLHGKAEVLEMQIPLALSSEGTPLPAHRLDGVTVNDAVSLSKEIHICGMVRGEGTQQRVWVPQGSERLLGGDRIFVLAEENRMHRVLQDLGFTERTPQKVFIYGGGTVGIELAHRLQLTCPRVSIIEPDRARTKELAFELTRALVFHGEGTDTELLKSEGIANADVYVAVTGNEDDNLISCLIANEMGCKNTIAMTSKAAFGFLERRPNTPTQVSHRMITVNQVLRYVLRGDLLDFDELVEGKIEALQYRVTSSTVEQGTGIPIRSEAFEAVFPRGCLIAAILRKDELIIPSAEENDTLEINDEVLVICPEELVDDVVSFFQPFQV